MKVVWQMVDAILIPILTHACEAWTPNKEEITKLQTIFNEALKTILSLPKGTPTTILLNETGNYPIELTIKKKKILHAKRIDSLKGEALIKDVTSPNNSEWRKEINRIAEEFNVKDQMTVLTKTSLQKHLHEEIKTKFMDLIENEYMEKNKDKTLERPQNWHQSRQETIIYGKTEQERMLSHNKDKSTNAASKKQLQKRV